MSGPPKPLELETRVLAAHSVARLVRLCSQVNMLKCVVTPAAASLEELDSMVQHDVAHLQLLDEILLQNRIVAYEDLLPQVARCRPVNDGLSRNRLYESEKPFPRVKDIGRRLLALFGIEMPVIEFHHRRTSAGDHGEVLQSFV